MVSRGRLLLILLTSCVLFLVIRIRASESNDVALGLVQFETVVVDDHGGHHRQNVVVRVTSEKDRVQSFGISNEAGLVFMPLPTGRYTFDALSQTGHPLKMKRPEDERWFDVREGQDTDVGVGFKE
jgi:hypothetical protein